MNRRQVGCTPGSQNAIDVSQNEVQGFISLK